jgi:toxin-antitoxin system PIN domain toxin
MAMCRLTQLGLLRLATNPQAFGDEAVTLADAWRLYDAILADPRIFFADEPPNLLPLWRGFTDRQTFSPKVWNDAYLAAFASVATCELITFDRGFSQYAGLPVSVLS